MIMLLPRVSLSALVIHLLLGNFCMISMAHAADMPMSDDGHHEVMQTTMKSTAVPSVPECEHCPKEEPAEQKSACDNGHCFSRDSSHVSVTNQSSNPGVSIPILSPIKFLDTSFELLGRPLSTAPPHPPISTRTIVLRF